MPLTIKIVSMAAVFALSSNLDNLAVGASLGFRGSRLSWRDNGLVAAVTTIGTVASAFAGHFLARQFAESAASLAGGALLLCLGSWIIVQEAWKGSRSRRVEQRDASSAWPAAPDRAPPAPQDAGATKLTLSELLVLALGLTLNNVPNGIGAGMLQIDIGLLAVLNFVASLLTLGLGIRIGRKGMRWIGTYAGYAAGVILATLGLSEMVF